MNIPREKVDLKQMEYRYQDALKNYQDSINEIAAKPQLVSSLTSEAFELFFTANLFEKDKNKITDYLLHYTESSLAVFKMALNIGNEISYKIAGNTYKIIPEDKSYDVSILKWTQLFYAAIILQKDVLLQQITVIDLNKINEKSSGSSEAYNLLYALFLQKWYHKTGDVSNDLLTASKATDLVNKNSALYDYMLDIGSPQIDIFSAILYNNKEETEQQFENALQYHKQYFEGASSKGIDDFIGIVSLPLSGLYVIAGQGKLMPEIRSDFIFTIS